MGFFDIFKKKADILPEKMTVNVTPKGIEINGTAVEIPCHVSTLSKLLGKPREVVYQTPRSEIPPRMLEKYPELAAKRINYTWDDLGIYCYTAANSVVNCIGIKHRIRFAVKHDPSSMFAGTLTINGCDWSSTMRGGVDMEAFRQVLVGQYSVNSEYSDFTRIEKLGTADDYTGVEIQLSGK